MKTRKILTFGLLLLLTTAQCQIKIFNDNWISIGSLQKGGFGIQLGNGQVTYFNPSVYGAYTWMNMSNSTDPLAKNWIVNYNNSHNFFVYGNGWVFCMGQSIGSDSSFKTNICEIESPLEKVLKLRGILYNAVKPVKGSDSLRILDNKGVWRTVATGHVPYLDSTQFKTGVLHRLLEEQKMKHLGVIAQEMEKVVPEAVRMMPDGKLSVEYYGLIGLLIEAIKEQQGLIESCLANSEKPLKSKADLEENGSILFQNIPNPFSKNTIIKYRISSEAKTASILIFDMQGLLLKTYNGLSQKGEIQINGYDLKPGMYLYSLIVDGSEAGTKRMILTR